MGLSLRKSSQKHPNGFVKKLPYLSRRRSKPITSSGSVCMFCKDIPISCPPFPQQTVEIISESEIVQELDGCMYDGCTQSDRYQLDPLCTRELSTLATESGLLIDNRHTIDIKPTIEFKQRGLFNRPDTEYEVIPFSTQSMNSEECGPCGSLLKEGEEICVREYIDDGSETEVGYPCTEMQESDPYNSVTSIYSGPTLQKHEIDMFEDINILESTELQTKSELQHESKVQKGSDIEQVCEMQKHSDIKKARKIQIVSRMPQGIDTDSESKIKESRQACEFNDVYKVSEIQKVKHVGLKEEKDEIWKETTVVRKEQTLFDLNVRLDKSEVRKIQNVRMPQGKSDSDIPVETKIDEVGEMEDVRKKLKGCMVHLREDSAVQEISVIRDTSETQGRNDTQEVSVTQDECMHQEIIEIQDGKETHDGSEKLNGSQIQEFARICQNVDLPELLLNHTFSAITPKKLQHGKGKQAIKLLKSPTNHAFEEGIETQDKIKIEDGSKTEDRSETENKSETVNGSETENRSETENDSEIEDRSETEHGIETENEIYGLPDDVYADVLLRRKDILEDKGKSRSKVKPLAVCRTEQVEFVQLSSAMPFTWKSITVIQGPARVKVGVSHMRSQLESVNQFGLRVSDVIHLSPHADVFEEPVVFHYVLTCQYTENIDVLYSPTNYREAPRWLKMRKVCEADRCVFTDTDSSCPANYITHQKTEGTMMLKFLLRHFCSFVVIVDGREEECRTIPVLIYAKVISRYKVDVTILAGEDENRRDNKKKYLKGSTLVDEREIEHWKTGGNFKIQVANAEQGTEHIPLSGEYEMSSVVLWRNQFDSLSFSVEWKMCDNVDSIPFAIILQQSNSNNSTRMFIRLEFPNPNTHKGATINSCSTNYQLRSDPSVPRQLFLSTLAASHHNNNNNSNQLHPQNLTQHLPVPTDPVVSGESSVTSSSMCTLRDQHVVSLKDDEEQLDDGSVAAKKRCLQQGCKEDEDDAKLECAGGVDPTDTDGHQSLKTLSDPMDEVKRLDFKFGRPSKL